MKDIFTDMQAKIGCPYLSDLPYYKRTVWFEMKRLCLSDYPKKQYLYPDNVVCHHRVYRHSLRGLTAVIAYRGGISEILWYSRCPHMVYEPKDL